MHHLLSALVRINSAVESEKYKVGSSGVILSLLVTESSSAQAPARNPPILFEHSACLPQEGELSPYILLILFPLIEKPVRIGMAGRISREDSRKSDSFVRMANPRILRLEFAHSHDSRPLASG